MKKRILIIIFLILLLALPFINKAVHFDDVFFIYIAKQTINDPLHPFSFDIEWAGGIGPATHMTDPPLLSWYIAVIILLFGEIEWVLHLSFIIFPLIAAISMYYISKKFTNKPLLPTILLITSVAFVVNVHNLMADIPFLAFFLLSVALFIYGMDSDNGYFIALGSLSSGLAYLTKYSGLIIFPILAIYALLKKKPQSILYLTIPVIIIGLWNFYTFKIYGFPHNLEVLNWLFRARESSITDSIAIRLITNFTYIGGATLFPLMLTYPFLIDKKNRWVYAFILIIASVLSIILYFVSVDFVFRYTAFQLVLFGFFLSTGLFFLFVIMWYYYHYFLKLLKNLSIFTKYSSDIFLFLWFLIVFLFNTSLAGGAVRYVVILAPPMMMIYSNLIDSHKFLNSKYFENFVFLGILLTLLLSISVAYADYKFANTYRDFAGTFEVKNRDSKVFYSGNNNFQYYMGKKGYTMIGQNDNSPKKGDLVIKAQIPSPRDFSSLLRERLTLMETKSYNFTFPIRVQNPKARAGFYTYGGGFLPYSFSDSSLEDFEIYEVVK